VSLSVPQHCWFVDIQPVKNPVPFISKFIFQGAIVEQVEGETRGGKLTQVYQEVS